MFEFQPSTCSIGFVRVFAPPASSCLVSRCTSLVACSSNHLRSVTLDSYSPSNPRCCCCWAPDSVPGTLDDCSNATSAKPIETFQHFGRLEARASVSTGQLSRGRICITSLDLNPSQASSVFLGVLSLAVYHSSLYEKKLTLRDSDQRM